MKLLFFISILFLSACTNGNGLNLGYYPDPNASKDNFIYCYGYGCTKTMRLGFSDHEWKQISKIFKKKSKTAKAERIKIGKAIALMEKYTGELAGTKQDLPKAPIIRKSFQELDCIDETVNTTKYLSFLKEAGFLKFHEVGEPVFKGMLNGAYPHNSASVIEIETDTVFVIDSYIYKNGAQPNIRGLDNWLQYRVEELEKAERLHRL